MAKREVDPVIAGLPSITYYPPDIGSQSVGAQSTKNADRPLSAWIAASACWHGNDCNDKSAGILGAARGLKATEIEKMFDTAWGAFDLDTDRAAQWAHSIQYPRQDCGIGRWPEFPGDLPMWEWPTPVGDQPLDTYQAEAIRQMPPGGDLLGFDMGLGKTVTAAAAARCYRRLNLDRSEGETHTRLWVVAPLNAFDAWDEVLPYLDEDFDEIELISQDSLHLVAGAADKGGVLIIDEIHNMGNADTKRAKEAHALRKKFTVCIGLTGTVTHGGVEKCMSMLDLVIPGAAMFSSRWKMGSHFKCIVDREVDMGSRTVSKKVLEDPAHDCEAFTDWLGRHCQIVSVDDPRVAADVKIPEQHVNTLPILKPWKPHAEAVVNCLEQHMAENDDEVPHMKKVAHMLARAECAAKLSWLAGEWDDTPVVIFCEYTDSIARILDWAKGQGIGVSVITGDTPKAQRRDEVASFQAGTSNLFVGQWKAASVSVTLTRACLSIGWDHTFSGTDYAQALRRTRRRGQTETCYHYDLCANKFQEAIVKRVRSRKDFSSKCAEWATAKAIRDAMEKEGAPCTP